MSVEIRQGDCLDVMATLEAESFHAAVTDPPYHLTNVAYDFRKTGAGNDRPARIVRSAGFMNQAWDGGDIAFRPETWAAVYRVLTPGAHLLAFGGTRTFHRLVCAIEDAGFEIRDTIMWLYGSGFPKSLDVSKTIDRAAPRAGMFDAFAEHFAERRKANGKSQRDIAQLFPSKTGGITGCVWNWENGANVPTPDQWLILQPLLGLSDEFAPLIERIEAEREIIGKGARNGGPPQPMWGDDDGQKWDITAPSTEAARQWQGWGTALKPACELICVARKPLSEPTVAANVLKHGTGALNIDASRVAATQMDVEAARVPQPAFNSPTGKIYNMKAGKGRNGETFDMSNGRWPANVAHDGSPEVLDAFARFGSSERSDKPHARRGQGFHNCLGRPDRDRADADMIAGYGGAGGTAARFFKECPQDLEEQKGRWPANVAHDGSPEVLDAFAKFGESPSSARPNMTGKEYGDNNSVLGKGLGRFSGGHADTGTAARFFKECPPDPEEQKGRWPANVAHDGSPEVLDAFARFGDAGGGYGVRGGGGTIYAEDASFRGDGRTVGFGDAGTAARFFYTAKADASERCDSKHPTVKPVALMEWLVRLVTPSGGRVLDPFCGTGSTLVACDRLGFDALGIEQDAQTVADAHEKIKRMRARRMIGDAKPAEVSEAQLGLPL